MFQVLLDDRPPPHPKPSKSRSRSNIINPDTINVEDSPAASEKKDEHEAAASDGSAASHESAPHVAPSIAEISAESFSGEEVSAADLSLRADDPPQANSGQDPWRTDQYYSW